IAAPQLEMSAPFFTPIAVEIDQQVEAPVELQLGMDVEVGVNFQKSARLDLMESAAAEVGVGNQSVDPGQRFEPQQHLEGVHVVEKIAGGLRDRGGLVRVAELFLERVIESPPLLFAGRRELA